MVKDPKANAAGEKHCNVWHFGKVLVSFTVGTYVVMLWQSDGKKEMLKNEYFSWVDLRSKQHVA